jgi:hypothetical protein
MSGILINSYRYAASGFTNTYSLDFDGVDDYVDLGISTTGTNDVSISCWIKTTETFAYTLTRCAFGGRDVTFGDNYTLGRLGSLFASPNDMKVRVFNTLGTTKLNDGDWHNIIFTYDYTTKEVKAYVDGNTTPEVSITVGLFRSKKIFIGATNQAIGSFYQGNVDECGLWYSVLTTGDVTSIYNSGAPGDLTALSPVGWWRNGDDATYPTIPDLGSGGNAGTMTNMVSGDIVAVVP